MWYVDLAPITDPEVVPVTVARALGLPDQPGRSTMETLHAVHRRPPDADACWTTASICSTRAPQLVVALLRCLPGLTLLATSREPIGVAGEVSWRVPSLSLADEAIELFTDRARRARPGFRVTDDERRRRGRDLPAPRRHAAGDRAGGGAGARVVADRDRSTACTTGSGC